MNDQMYQVIGTGPDGQSEVGVPRPRDEALRIFAAVIAARPGDFHPRAEVRVKVVAVAR